MSTLLTITAATLLASVTLLLLKIASPHTTPFTALLHGDRAIALITGLCAASIAMHQPYLAAVSAAAAVSLAKGWL